MRVIEGQKSKLSRTMHGIAYDPVRDQIIVPVALAAAVLVFRGGASGEEAPVRVIQGPHTRMIRPQSVGVDPKSGEIYAVDVSRRSILVYAAGANGDPAPIRELHGPKTGLLKVTGVCVDPIADKVVVVSTSHLPGGKTGLFIFNRTDNGDVAPQAVIAGPHTGMFNPWEGNPWEVACDPQDGKIFLGVGWASGGGPGSVTTGASPYGSASYKLRKPRPGAERASFASHPRKEGFIGVWNITDNGDVPPRAWIRGPYSDQGVAIDPKDGEVFGTNAHQNGLFMFLVPQFFKNLAGGGQSPN